MKDLPETFSWHLVEEHKDQIEKPRNQYIGNCWAIAIASVFSDSFCLANGIKTCNLFSSAWITSMMEGNYADGYSLYTLSSFEDNENFFDLRIDKCYPEKSPSSVLDVYYFNDNMDNIYNGTLEKVFFIDNLRKKKFESPGSKILFTDPWKKGFNTEAEYLGVGDEQFKRCCTKNIQINLKDDKKNLKDTECTNIFVGDEELKLKFPQIYTFDLDSNFVTDQIIKEYNDHLKHIILCISEGPVYLEMYATNEYKKYKNKYRRSNSCDIPVFVASEPRPQGVNHALSVLGWGKDDSSGIEFWYIRDSNTNNYLKIEMLKTMSKYNYNIISYKKSILFTKRNEFKDDKLLSQLIENGIVEYSDSEMANAFMDFAS